MKSRHSWITCTALGSALFIAACGKPPAEDTPAAAGSVDVHATQVRMVQQPRMQLLPATVHPADRAQIAAKVMAVVAADPVVIGRRVQAGDLLLQLQADEIAAQVEQATAGLAQIERNLARERRLLEQNATTPETVRTLEDQLRMATARLSEARTMQGYLSITAPFDGVIVSKHVRRGDLASPGQPLLELEGHDRLEVHTHVPDSLALLELDAVLDVHAKGTTVSARLSEWSPAADPASRTRLAKLVLPEQSSLRSGQYVQVAWPAEPSEALIIPANAVQRIGQIERVFIIDQDALRIRLIRTGARIGDQITVRSGLEAGELIVVDPAATLREGQTARIAS
jgi:RND family efflux transporter MFP subunit